MALIDLNLPKSIARALNLPVSSPKRQQLKVLKKMLRKARFTSFGQTFKFDEILLSKHVGKKFQKLVPTFNYTEIYKDWWHKALEGKPDICWPGVINFFALSSGTVSHQVNTFLSLKNFSAQIHLQVSGNSSALPPTVTFQNLPWVKTG